jgi:hypothetical protein
MTKKTSFLIALLSLVLSACQTATPTDAPPASKPENTATFTLSPLPADSPTPSPIPTDTPIPSETNILTATFTQSPSDTPPTATPNPFDAAEILNFNHLGMGNNLLLVVFQFPDDLEGEYYAIMEDLVFTCEILDDYPDRLYCNGDNVKAGQQVTFEIFRLDNHELVYSEEFLVPQLPTATP